METLHFSEGFDVEVDDEVEELMNKYEYSYEVWCQFDKDMNEYNMFRMFIYLPERRVEFSCQQLVMISGKK